MTLRVAVPVNSSALVGVPKTGSGDATVTESGRTIWQAGKLIGGVRGVTSGAESRGYVTFGVGSGSYVFRLTQ